MSHVIELQSVTKRYRRGGETLTVLDDLDLSIEAGEVVALMGPSGSGKSTILNVVGGLDRPDSGTVRVAGETISDFPDRRLPGWRARHIGFVFQSFNLVPVLTARENVMLPLLLTPLSRAERGRQADFALEIVGLADRAGHRPRQLSGGQEQRVAIARAIASDPEIVLADEPTGDLDRDSATSIMELIGRLNEELGKTFVVVTHDELVGDCAGRVLHLDKGVLNDTTATAGPPRP